MPRVEAVRWWCGGREREVAGPVVDAGGEVVRIDTCHARRGRASTEGAVSYRFDGGGLTSGRSAGQVAFRRRGYEWLGGAGDPQGQRQLCPVPAPLPQSPGVRPLRRC